MYLRKLKDIITRATKKRSLTVMLRTYDMIHNIRILLKSFKLLLFYIKSNMFNAFMQFIFTFVHHV